MYKIIENYKETGEAIHLEELRPFFMGSVGVTLNLPRVKSFISLQSTDQKYVLVEILRDALKNVKKEFVVSYHYCFETCQDGHQHLHGIIYGCHKNKTTAFIMDLSRTIQRAIKKAFKLKFQYKNGYYDMYQRIKLPSHCLQVMRTIEECERWIMYMCKEQIYDHDL